MEMISGSSFEWRLADMNNGSTPRPRKRSIYSTYSTPTQTVRQGLANELLGPSDKRMKSILDNTRTRLFPPSAKPVMQQATHVYEDPIMQQANHVYETRFDYLAPVRGSQFSPRTFSSAIRPRPKPAMKALATPSLLGKPEKYYRDLQVAQLATVYRVSQVAPRMTLLSSSLGYDWGRNARHDEEQRENEALRRENQDLRQYNLAAREGLERARAKELKQALELEKFKRQVSVESKLRDAGRAPAFQSVRGRTDGYALSHAENLSRDVVVVSAGSSGSLSDDENVASSSGGHETNQEPTWRALYNKAREPNKISSLEKEIEYTASRLRALQLVRPAKVKAEKKPEEDKTLVDAFTPLSDEAELAVDEALDVGDRYEILVTHDRSNIEVTRAIIQCLSPGVWLNDEVINVYMDLLKERETREPDRFLKCHFFSTFFYNKLYKDKRSYDYKAIRRWTTQKKLGYSLSDCDKILVPIHQDIHWCLAVINIRDKQLQYLDSLKGGDHSVLDVLARYIADESKDKDGKVLDVSTWEHDFPKDIPEQLNGCDCGMFMVKYADFHSRGAPLQFSQDNMDYFRRKMVWEILDLTAT